MADDVKWLSYRELAKALGITVDSARRLATRHKEWSRQKANDGTVRIAVPLDRLPDDAPDVPHDDGPDVEPDIGTDTLGTVAALQAHIETLRDALAKAEARADAEHDRANAAQADANKAALDALRAVLERDQAQGELDRLRAMPWWRRIGA